MDEGWTRWLFEQFGFAYTDGAQQAISRQAACAQKFDAIVFTDQPAASIENGSRAMPCPKSTPAGSAREERGRC